MDVKIFGGNVKWEIESADAARNFKAAGNVKWEIESADAARNFKAAATLFIAHLTFPI